MYSSVQSLCRPRLYLYVDKHYSSMQTRTLGISTPGHHGSQRHLQPLLQLLPYNKLPPRLPRHEYRTTEKIRHEYRTTEKIPTPPLQVAVTHVTASVASRHLAGAAHIPRQTGLQQTVALTSAGRGRHVGGHKRHSLRRVYRRGRHAESLKLRDLSTCSFDQSELSTAGIYPKRFAIQRKEIDIWVSDHPERESHDTEEGRQHVPESTTESPVVESKKPSKQKPSKQPISGETSKSQHLDR